MADEPGLSRKDEQDSSSDDDTVRGEQDAHHIAEILEEELQAPSTPTPLGNGSLAHRYHEIVKENEADAASETGSTDAAPRRAGSPIDSLLSIPDDTPSVQVCWSCLWAFTEGLHASRAPPSRPLAAACFPRSPTGPVWAVRHRLSVPLTAGSSRAYTRHLSYLPDRPPRLSSEATAGAFLQAASCCSTEERLTRPHRLGKLYDGQSCGSLMARCSRRLEKETLARQHAWPCLPT